MLTAAEYGIRALSHSSSTRRESDSGYGGHSSSTGKVYNPRIEELFHISVPNYNVPPVTVFC